MPSRILISVRSRIIQLANLGKQPEEIRGIVGVEGHIHTVTAIRQVILRFQRNGQIKDSPRGGRKCKLQEQHLDIIHKHLKKNDESTSVDLQIKLREKSGINFAISTIKKARRRLGWVKTGVKYCQLIRVENQLKRIQYAIECLKQDDKFHDMVFTDESSVEIDRHAKVTFRNVKDGSKRVLKPKPKHPSKVHVWAGISCRGATKLLIFDGIMKKEFYTDEILKEGLKPFVEKYYPEGHRFMQDNDPKHTSKYAAEFMKTHHINWTKTPPESPDMNPIEKVWNEMKGYLRKIHKPTTKEELVDGLQTFWRTRMTPSKCQKYISNLRKVIPAVIQCGGQATGY